MKIDDTRQGTGTQSNPRRHQTSPFALGVLGLALILAANLPSPPCSSWCGFGLDGCAPLELFHAEILMADSSSLNGQPGRQITQFNSEQIPAFGWSPDGKKLLVGRWHEESDVVLLRDTSK